MLDETGKLTDPDSARTVVLNFDSKADPIAFRELKFVLQYEDFFDGRHLLLLPDPFAPKKWVVAHRCGGTVIRTVSHLDLGDIPKTRAGFYMFSGDDGESMFPEMWKSNIKISLRCRFDDAVKLCNENPDYEAVPEWKFLLKNLYGENDIPPLMPCNMFDCESDLSYYEPIVFSTFLKNLYHLTPGKVFFNHNSMKSFISMEDRWGLIGELGNVLVSEFKRDGIVERTFLFSMDKDSGYFDYDAFDKAK